MSELPKYISLNLAYIYIIISIIILMYNNNVHDICDIHGIVTNIYSLEIGNIHKNKNKNTI